MALDAIAAALLTKAITMKGVWFAVTLLIMLSMSLAIIPFDAAAGDGVVRLYAAGSLRPAFIAIIAAFQKAQGIKVEPTLARLGCCGNGLRLASKAICSPQPIWDSPSPCRRRVRRDRLFCLRATGFVRWSGPTWTSPRKLC